MKVRIASGIAIAFALATFGPHGVGSATAQPDFKAAALHYKSAEAAMATGDYRAAALEYGVAYDITKDPILFFKIGTANEKAGRCPIALTYFARYLKEGNPSEEYRRLAEERITACKATLGEGSGGGGTTPPPADPPGGGAPDPGGAPRDPGDDPGGGGISEPGGDTSEPAGELGAGGPSFTDTTPTWTRTSGWIATGATIGLLAVATVLYMSAEGSEEDLQALIDFRDGNGQPVPFSDVRRQHDDLLAEGERFDRLATFAFAAAGVGAAAAVTFFILDVRSGGSERPGNVVGTRARSYLGPRVDRHGAGVVMGWEF